MAPEPPSILDPHLARLQAGVPEPITCRMQAAVSQALSEAAVRARMDEQGADIVASSPEDCAAFIRRDMNKWARVIRENNIRAVRSRLAPASA